MDQVGIYNLALGRIGVDKTVASLTETSKESRLCNRFYAQCRDEVLEAAAWPFAVKVQALAQLTDTDLRLPGWDYQYAKPSDALRILETTTDADVGASIGYWTGCCGPWQANSRGADNYRLALAANGGGQIILSNVDTPYAVYVARVTDETVFSPLMVSCIADRLAMELSLPMTGDPRWLQAAMTRYNQSFTIAAATSYEQQRDGPDAEPPSIRARY